MLYFVLCCFFFLFFWEWHVFGNCYSQMLSSERERYNKALELAQKKASWCPWLCSMLVLSAVLVSLYLLSGLLLETALISSMSLCWSPVTRQSWKNVGCHFLDRDLRVLSLHFFIYEKWIMTGVHVHVDIHVYVYMCVCPCVFRNTRSCSEQHPATSFFFFNKQYVLEIFPCQYIKFCHIYSALWLHYKFI